MLAGYPRTQRRKITQKNEITMELKEYLPAIPAQKLQQIGYNGKITAKTSNQRRPLEESELSKRS